MLMRTRFTHFLFLLFKYIYICLLSKQTEEKNTSSRFFRDDDTKTATKLKFGSAAFMTSPPANIHIQKYTFLYVHRRYNTFYSRQNTLDVNVEAEHVL